jgi:hypothetical protein
MKRAAYVASWIAFVLYSAAGVLTFVTGLPSVVYLAVVAAILGLTLIAFHAKLFRPLRIVAAVLNGVLALLVFVMVATGINFAAGRGAFLTAAVLLVVFFVPAVLNTIAMVNYVRESSVVPAS